MIGIWYPLSAAAVNEFRMQTRRRAMWLAMIAASGIFPLLAWQTLDRRFGTETPAQAIADTTDEDPASVRAMPLVRARESAHIVGEESQHGLTTRILDGALRAVWVGARMSSKAPD